MMNINVNKIMKKFMPSKISDGKVAFTTTGGLAFKNKAGNYISYDAETNTAIDNMQLVFDNTDMFYTIPTPFADIKTGDYVQERGYYYYVTEAGEDELKVINLSCSSDAIILPEKNVMFGQRPILKVVNLMNATADTDNFNPMMLLLSEDGDIDPTTFFLMQSMQNAQGTENNGSAFNSLLMLALAKNKDEYGYDNDRTDIKDILLMQMMNGNTNLFASDNASDNASGFNPMMLMLADGDIDAKKLMLMQMMGNTSDNNNGFNPMMFMLLNDDGDTDITKLMLMQQLSGNAQATGTNGFNLMMLALLSKDDDNDMLNLMALSGAFNK